MAGDLRGAKIIVTRPTIAAKSLIDTLTQLGAHVTNIPLFSVESLYSTDKLRQIARDLPRYDLVICISRNAAELVLPYINDLTLIRWAAIGPGTTSFLRQAGASEVICTLQSPFDSNSLLLELQLRNKTLKNQCIIILAGADGDKFLAESLQQLEALVEVVALYKRTMPQIAVGQLPSVLRSVAAADIMVVTCITSLANLQVLSKSAGINFFNIPLLVVSSRIATYAREKGFVSVHVAKGMSDSDIMTALLSWRNNASE